ncbi:MAG TPA: SGNH/GDSL hydrolase family protein [Thermoanaerobaculia bacterium]
MYRTTALVSLLALVLLVPGAALAVNTGSADFTNYVSAGDSLTAGFMSGSLIDTSQLHDYPVIIATQAGVSDFEQPLVSPPGIPAILHLVGLFPTVIVPEPGQGQPENLNLPRLYNNLAVPGETAGTMITVKSDVPSTGKPGLHDLILRGFGTQLEEVIGAKPTFVSLWIGNNDALGAATSGNVALLTPLPVFTQEYQTIVGAIASMTGAKMVIANIPDVTSIPFVTTIPPFLVDPTTNQPVIFNGNLVPLIGPKGLLGPGDHVLLSAGPDLNKGLGIPRPLGTGLPLPASDVLLAADAATIDNQVAAFNVVIQATAQQVGAAFVDANALLKELATTGIQVGGIPFNASFLTGGVFAYDGVHPTHFGYAFLANAFIDAINQKFGAAIPPANLSPAIFGEAIGGPLGSASSLESSTASLSSATLPIVWTRYLFTAEAMRNLESVLVTPTSGSGGHHRRPH